jgi:c-di-GMP-binding flagellar brake protein YcgR
MKSRPNPRKRSIVEDRRRFPRISAVCAVRYKPVRDIEGLEVLEKQQRGSLQNISGGGIGFVAEEELQPDQTLALEIALSDSPGNVLAYGKVRWCRKRIGGPGYDVGVEFAWIGWENQEAQARIRGFLARALAEED